jgi:hypothetical protein
MATIVDLNSAYDNAENSIKAVQTFNQVSQDNKQITAQQQSSQEKAAEETVSPLTQLQENKKKFQRQTETQLDKLLNLNQLLPDNRLSGKSSSSVVSLVKNDFIIALNQIKSEIPGIIKKAMLKQLGCSQEQTYDVSTFSAGGIFIPVESVDLFGLLKESPTTPMGKLMYETLPTDKSFKDLTSTATTTTTTTTTSRSGVQKNPYFMNRQLYERIQNEGVSYDATYGQNYLGLSQQGLLDVTYVTEDDNGNQGSFFQVKLPDRLDNKNLVSQFITDYFETIKMVDTKNIYLRIFQVLFGAMSIQLKNGSAETESQLIFQRILTRILGLCFDDRSEIDVSGVAKVAPLDGIDESFFELTDVDLRIIENDLSNIQRGVVEYPDCTTVKLPIDTEALFNTFLGILEVDDNNSDGNSKIFNKSIASVTDNPQWPQGPEIQFSVDTNIIKAIPQALYASVLSPKVLLPFMVMYKAIEGIALGKVGSVVNEVYNLQTFLKTFQTLNVDVMSEIGARFVKILRDLIVRDIRKLLQSVVRDLKKSQVTKQYAVIFQLIEGAILITQLVTDYRKCKSVIGDIINIIEFALRGTRIEIPPFLLFLSTFRTGFNDIRASLEVIKELQKAGIPTGPMPDGSPNLFLQSIVSQIKGTESERTKNSKMVSMTPAQVITPSGFTVPRPMTGVPL